MNLRTAFVASALTVSAATGDYMAIEEWRAPYVAAQKFADERQQKLEELLTGLKPISDAVLRVEYDPGFRKARAYLDDIFNGAETDEKRRLTKGTKAKLEEQLGEFPYISFSVVLPQDMEYEKLKPSIIYVGDGFFDKRIVTNESDQLVVLAYALMRARHNKKGLALGDIVTHIELERATGASTDYEMMRKANDNSIYAKFPREVRDDDELMEAMTEYACLTAQMTLIKEFEKTGTPINTMLRASIKEGRDNYKKVIKSHSDKLIIAELQKIKIEDPRPYFAREALRAYQLK